MTRNSVSLLSALEKEVGNGLSLLVAVSGGLDSMCLLTGLCQLQEKKELQLAAVHVDHSLRAESSRRDAEFVKGACEKLGVDFFTRVLESPPEKNKEKWARDKRYQVIAEILDSEGFDYCLTAHHSGDVAETLLLRLFRNKEIRPLLSVDDERKLLRPLLRVSKEALRSFADSEHVAFVEDPSNKSDEFERNRLRNRVIPFLKKELDPRIEEILAERALALEEDEVGLDSFSASKFRHLSADTESHEFFEGFTQLLEDSPSFLHWRFVNHWLRPVLGFRLGRRSCETVLDVIQMRRVATELPGGLEIRRSEKRLYLFQDGVQLTSENRLKI